MSDRFADGARIDPGHRRAEVLLELARIRAACGEHAERNENEQSHWKHPPG